MNNKRINYKKIGKQIRNNKFNKIKQKKQLLNTCEYSEGEGHSLCTHPENCILDPKRKELNELIDYKKRQLKDLKNSLRNGLDLMKKYPDKKSYELKVGFYPNQMRDDIKLLENELRDLRREEMNLRG